MATPFVEVILHVNGREHLFTSFAKRSNTPNDKPMSGVAVWQMVRRYAQASDLEH